MLPENIIIDVPQAGQVYSGTIPVAWTPAFAVEVASVVVSPGSFSEEVGQTEPLSATAYDAQNNVILGISFTWSSSDETIATVSTSGLVTAQAEGSANIRATAPNGIFGESIATVTSIPTPVIVSTVISPDNSSIIEGNTVQLTALSYDSEGTSVLGVYTWTTSNSAVATVQNNGSQVIVTGISPGTVTITATEEGGSSDTTTVTVTAVSSTECGPTIGLDFELCPEEDSGLDFSLELNT